MSSPVKEVFEMPPWAHATLPHADFLNVRLAKQLHSHHSEDEDDDAEDKGQVGEGAHGGLHDGQDVIE